MRLLDAFWHLMNLFGPAAGMALILPSLAKLVWRAELRAVAWVHLALWVGTAGAAVLALGLGLQGRDGRMGTYIALVLGCSLALWWRGWHHKTRG